MKLERSGESELNIFPSESHKQELKGETRVQQFSNEEDHTHEVTNSDENNIPSWNILSFESETFCEETTLCANKSISRIELPEMTTVFTNGKNHTVREICVDSEIPPVEKVILEDNEGNDWTKYSNFDRRIEDADTTKTCFSNKINESKSEQDSAIPSTHHMDAGSRKPDKEDDGILHVYEESITSETAQLLPEIHLGKLTDNLSNFPENEVYQDPDDKPISSIVSSTLIVSHDEDPTNERDKNLTVKSKIPNSVTENESDQSNEKVLLTPIVPANTDPGGKSSIKTKDIEVTTDEPNQSTKTVSSLQIVLPDKDPNDRILTVKTKALEVTSDDPNQYTTRVLSTQIVSPEEDTNGKNLTVRTEALEVTKDDSDQSSLKKTVSVDVEFKDFTDLSRSIFFQHGLGESSFSRSSLSGMEPNSRQLVYSGDTSMRSESSTTSIQSFAFPILRTDWNGSPERMKSRRRGFRRHLLCCRF